MCPDIGPYDLHGGNKGDRSLSFRIDLVDKTLSTDDMNSLLWNTEIMTWEMSRYYTYDLYKEHGYMPFIMTNENVFDLQPHATNFMVSYVMQQTTTTFDFKWIDTSQISLVDFGTTLYDYKTDRERQQYRSNAAYDDPVLKLYYVQSDRMVMTEWSIASIDIILGLVGGVSGILWTGLAMLLSPYETFKFNNSLIGMVYPTAPQRDEKEQPIRSRDKAQEQLERTVSDRGKAYYSFTEYYWTWFLRSCCCCCFRQDSTAQKRRTFRYERYEEAVDRLASEIDILTHIENQRASRFLQKLSLSKHQRALVSSFQRYRVEELDDEKCTDKNAKDAQDKSKVDNQLLDKEDPKLDFSDFSYLDNLTEAQKELLEEIRLNFKPDSVLADTCILYEVTQFKD